MRLLLLVLPAIGLTLFTWLPSAPGGLTALANGTPVRVVLGYLPGVSNWGPTDAAGVAELVFKEGEVRLSVVGSQRRGSGAYNIWLIKAANGAAYNLGRFNVGPDGTARLDYVLPNAIPEENWDLMLISVEEGGPPAAPGPRRSIAGRIEPPEGAAGAPAELPRTGGDSTPPQAPGPWEPPPAGLTALGFGTGAGIVFGLGFMLGRLRRRGR